MAEPGLIYITERLRENEAFERLPICSSHRNARVIRLGNSGIFGGGCACGHGVTCAVSGSEKIERVCSV